MTQLDPHWTAYLSALLTPLLAIFGAIIAWRQSCISKNKLKLDLFEKRFAVYNKARNMLGEIMMEGKLTNQELQKYGAGIQEAKWLFDDQVAKYLGEELWGRAVDLQNYDAELDGKPSGDERTSLINDRNNLKQWFFSQYKALDSKFDKFLKMSH
jgi:hypothetical protein